MSSPVGPYPIPAGRTARRLVWEFLPPHLRSAIEAECGSPVVETFSQTSGFTPGFASVLVCADGSRHFVKAASVKAQQLFADSYREEARKLATLPRTVAAPRLLWVLDDDWVVLGIEHVEGRAPERPWRQAELDAVLDTLEVVADELTPPPAALDLDTAEDDFKPLVAMWEHIAATRPDLPHLAEAGDLAAGFAEVVGGTTLVHTDVRDDNVLLGNVDGRVWLCDWNWPIVGAPWLDTLMALIGPRGDGLDVESVLASRRLTRDVHPEAIDRVLALLVGFFLKSADDPVPHTSPFIREHQRWQGEVLWEWLCERRGWRA
ncbi:phosphotransferase family protein [Nocardioides piscis]|uniref:Aminoglycoside phosphotransferase domain-containing protein n=1 Tax=Nocardioides piscis TaxID=2714938 RepID=A0A6G7YGQ6_9ACTN|nr:hypothetical protein [Nocardioides piscis]QIK75983.1 hypothetical protein G7071_11590 [Nocardioides piscis]